MEKKIEKLQKDKHSVENNNNSNRVLEELPSAGMISQSTSTKVVSTIASKTSPTSITSPLSMSPNPPTTSSSLPFTRTSSPHTPPGKPPCIRSPTFAATSGTSGTPLLASALTESTSQTRTDYIPTPTSALARALPITEDYIVGINQIDLGPRVNDLSKI